MRIRREYKEVIREDIRLKEHGESKRFRKGKNKNELEIYINVSSKEMIKEKGEMLGIEMLIERLCNQKGRRTLAKKSISNYRLKEKSELGLKISLKKRKAYEFMEMFVCRMLPRVKHFESINFKDWKVDEKDEVWINMGLNDLRVFWEYKEIAEEHINNKKVGFNVTIGLNSKINYSGLV